MSLRSNISKPKKSVSFEFQPPRGGLIKTRRRQTNFEVFGNQMKQSSVMSNTRASRTTGASGECDTFHENNMTFVFGETASHQGRSWPFSNSHLFYGRPHHLC